MGEPGEEALVARAVGLGLLTPAQVEEGRRLHELLAARGNGQGLLALLAARHLRVEQAAALLSQQTSAPARAGDATVTHAGGAPAASPAAAASRAPAASPASPASSAPARASGRLAAVGAAGSRLGPYVVERELARGGMGAVLVARHEQLGRRVAIKVVLGHDPKHIERFRIEAQATARLRHPNIVTVHEVGVADGRPYLVMDLVAGRSLADRIARGGPLAPREAAALGETLARALGVAHAAGVLHRDIKPANVLLREEDSAPVITDFGLAKDAAEATRLTRTGQVIGTPAFMPPEQATGQHDRVGPASDVYALGATLYAALTGQPPFAGDMALNVLVAVVRTPPSSVRVCRPEVDAALDAIVLRCLAKEPAARFPSADALADALRAWLDGGGAPPRRRRRAALAAGAVSLLAGAALAGALALREDAPAGALARSPGEDAPPSPAPRAPRTPSSPAPADAGRRAEEEAAAEAERVAIERAPPAARFARLERWLERWPTHPRAADARAALARLGLEAPRRALGHEACRGAIFAPGRGAGPERAVTFGGVEVALWDPATGARLRDWRLERECIDVDAAPDGSGLVVVDGSGAATWLDLDGHARRVLHDAGPAQPLTRVAYTPDGARLALGGPVGSARVVDASDGRLLRELPGHGAPIRALASSSTRLFTGCGLTLEKTPTAAPDNAVRAWDLATGELLWRFDLGASCEALDLSRDGARLAISTAWRVVLHEAATGAAQGELDGRARGEADFLSGRAHRGIVQGARFDATGALLVSAAGDTDQPAGNDLAVWDLATGRERLRAPRPPLRCSRLEVDASGRRFLVATPRGAELWDLAGLDAR